LKTSNLLARWKTVKFGDVCKVQGGFAFKSVEYQKTGIPLVRISNLVNAKMSFDSDTVHLSETTLSLHREFILQKGDTLIAMSGATTGKMATFDIDTPALLNQRVGRFRILSESLCTPRFISLLVTQITKKVLKEAYGAAQPNISPKQIEQMEVPLPPLADQHQLVAEIEKQFTRLEAGVAALRRVQANLKRYRAAVLKAAFEGKLVPTEAELTAKNAKSAKTKPDSFSVSSAFSAVKHPGFESGEALLARILTERRDWFDRQQANAKTTKKYIEPARPETGNLPSLPEGRAASSSIRPMLAGARTRFSR
jgi:type I restriction enzyme S subunit